MIRHHNGNTEIEFCSVVMQTGIEHDLPNTLRENPSMMSAECDEVLPVVILKMRKPSSIEGLRHEHPCGDSDPRLSAERSSAAFDLSFRCQYL